MADTAARLAIAARRNEIARFSIVVKGIDLSGAVLSMQIRLGRDVPGPPLFSLGTVNSTAAEGLKFESVTVIDGVPTSVISARINASTMTDATKVPYAGEMGDNTTLAYAMQWTLGGDARTRLYGDFIVVGSAFGSDNAPTNRPPSYGSCVSASGGSSGASLQFGDQIVQVSIDGAGLLGGLVAAANAAASAAAGHATRAQNAADAANEDELESGRNAADAGAYLEAVRSAVSGVPISAQLSLQATSRAMMASFPVETSGRQAILSEKGHEGLFVTRSKTDDPTLSAKAAGDTRQIAYVQSATDPDKVWVRDTSLGASPKWADAAGNGVDSDAPAYGSALSLLASVGVNENNGVYKGSPPLLVPAVNSYMGTTTLVVPNTMRLQGLGTGQAGGVVSKLTWAPGTIGIRFERYNTSNGQISNPTHYGADGSILDGFALSGGYAGVASPASHAISTNCRVTVRDSTMDSWGGDGLRIFGSSGGSPAQEGNGNCFAVERVRVTNCFHGISIGVGADADTNAGYTLGVDVSSNRGCGIYDAAFINNTHIAAHAAGNELGDYRSINPNSLSLWLGCYAEGGYQPSVFAPLNMRIGGILGSGHSGGTHIYTTLVDDSSTLNIEPQLRIAGVGDFAAIIINSGAQQRVSFRTNNGERAVISQGDNRLFYSVLASDAFHDWRIAGAQVMALDTANLAPGADNALSLGNASKRWSNVYAATGTINTSDRNSKTEIRPLSNQEFEALLDAVASVPLVAFKFTEAVQAKGDKARDHYGIIAQDLAEALEAQGLDVFAGGVLGRDQVVEEVEVYQDVERPVTRAEKYSLTVVEVINGVATQREIEKERRLAVVETMPVFDEHRKPVMIAAVEAHTKQQRDQYGNPLRGADGEIEPPIEVPASPARQLMHTRKCMETVSMPVKITRPKVDGEGNPVWLWSVRYDEFWALRMASIERGAGR